MDFCHLHNHTIYSFFDGVARPKNMVEKAKELGMPAVAITDHGNMFGAVEFYKEAVNVGIKPIVGIEAYAVPMGRSRFDRIMYRKEDPTMRNNHHILLLAKDITGFETLAQLTTLSFQDGFYIKPRIDFDLLARYNEGVICASACLAGEVNHWLKMNKYDKAKSVASALKEIFGEDFYLEVQNAGIPEQIRIIPNIIKLSKELDIKMIMTNDCHYVEPKDAEVQHTTLLLQQNLTEDEREQSSMELGKENYLKTDQEMLTMMPDLKEALTNTVEVADKCNLELSLGNMLLPKYDITEDAQYAEYLAATGGGNNE